MRGLLAVALCVALATATAARADLSDGLVAYYPFSGNALDASGHGNDCTVHGATLAPDRHGAVGSAYSFDGIDDYVDCSDYSSFDLSVGLSLTAWVKPDSVAGGRIISKWGLGSGYELDFYYSELELALNQYIIATASVFGLDGGWFFVAATWDGSDGQLFIGASSAETFSYADPLAVSSYNLLIGVMANMSPDYYDGVIDEVRIYNRALSDFEVATLAGVGIFADDFESGNTSAWSSTEPPSAEGDECLNAFSVTDGWVQQSDLELFSGDIDHSSCGLNDTADVWYRYTATCDGTATVTSCDPGNNFDAVLSIFRDCVADELDCNDNDPACSHTPSSSTVTFAADVGLNYFIRVSGVNKASFDPDDVVSFEISCDGSPIWSGR